MLSGIVLMPQTAVYYQQRKPADLGDSDEPLRHHGKCAPPPDWPGELQLQHQLCSTDVVVVHMRRLHMLRLHMLLWSSAHHMQLMAVCG
jgi:hypothetical protein